MMYKLRCARSLGKQEETFFWQVALSQKTTLQHIEPKHYFLSTIKIEENEAIHVAS